MKKILLIFALTIMLSSAFVLAAPVEKVCGSIIQLFNEKVGEHNPNTLEIGDTGIFTS